jgi:hypothetical protein
MTRHPVLGVSTVGEAARLRQVDQLGEPANDFTVIGRGLELTHAGVSISIPPFSS